MRLLYTFFSLCAFYLAVANCSLAQIPQQKGNTNYLKRNQYFQEKRQLRTPVNFAKQYTEAYREVQAFGDRSHLRRAKTWTPKGPFGKQRLAGTGRINSMQFHPKDTNTWFICVAQGGLWKTSNAGQSWTSISGNLPILRTSSLLIHPDHPDTMYVAMGDYAYLGHNLMANENKRNSHYGIGVYKTSDGGKSWNATGLSFKQTDFEGSLLSGILMHPIHKDTLIAVGQTGCYLSYDAGKTWNKTNSQLFWDLKQDPDFDNVLYATTGYVESYRYGQASIMKSTDFGKTWSISTAQIPLTGAVQRIELAIAPSDPNYIYAIACDTLGGLYGFYRSTNRGSSFDQRIDGSYTYNILNASLDNNPGGQGRYDLAICVDQSNKHKVWVGGTNMWQTSNGGLSFEPVTYWLLNYYGIGLHADIHELKLHPANGSVFACHDGGISRSFSIQTNTISELKDDGITSTEWTHYTNGLNITSYYRLSVNPVNGKEIMVGAQDNSTTYTDGSTFYNLSGGDGMESVFNDVNRYRYTSSQNGRIYAFTYDIGAGFSYDRSINPPSGERGEWTTPFVLSQGQPLVGYGNVHTIVNGRLGSRLSNFPNAPKRNFPKLITALTAEKTNGKQIYLAKRGYSSENISNEIWVSGNGGSSWQNRSAGLPDSLYPSYFEMSQKEPEKSWIVFSGFDKDNKVFYSKDSGKQWTNITYNLPKTSVNCVSHQNDGSDFIYIGTDLGVFYLKKDSTRWMPYNDGLPPVTVSELEVDTTHKKLVAATFGRGIWEVDLLDYTPPAVVSIKKQPEQYESISVSPNPVRAKLTLKLSRLEAGTYPLTVIDIMGRTVFTTRLSVAKGGEVSRDFDFSSLLSGEYFLILHEGDRRMVRKFVKY